MASYLKSYAASEIQRLQHRFQRKSSSCFHPITGSLPSFKRAGVLSLAAGTAGRRLRSTVGWSGDVFGPRTAAAVFTHDPWGTGMFWWLDKLGILSAGGSSWVGAEAPRRPDFWI
ncbi:hypothetical protein [Paenibacillus sp. MDMC362]|uniref:hypothetical protein n=1 Tax=Paenibacillus sp. MDMC362 TaxID=2977365 RepID=UPI0021A61731|nr:hypothetical protein [Paenibacillus sp. MDMC362]